MESRLVGDELLGDDTGHADHGKSAVVELLGAHHVEGGGVGGLEVERVEAEVAVDVVLLEVGDARASGVGLIGALPADDDVLTLHQSDGEEHDLPEVGEDGVGLLELVDGGAGDLSVEERVEVLSDEHAEEGEHAHTAVLELGFTDLLHLSGGLVGREGEGIEVSQRL